MTSWQRRIEIYYLNAYCIDDEICFASGEPV
jgi:hypothetical protein